VGPEMIQHMEEQLKTIRKGIKEVKDQKNSYVDAHRFDCNCEVGDRVFLRVKPHKILIKFGRGTKLYPRLWGISKL
jgi:hypothetical protein